VGRKHDDAYSMAGTPLVTGAAGTGTLLATGAAAGTFVLE